jgi:phage shock protein PspC (stress-responsive transcriptional regulator)
MKKNITINLCGRLFQIDEDAYELLQQYIESLRQSFGREEGGDEIVNDIEARIAELFDELRQQGVEAITIEHVKDIITRIGKPEELTGEEEKQENSGHKYDSFRSAAQGIRDNVRARTAGKRLYRNPNDKMVAGVLSGIAAYTGSDVTWWRIGYAMLILASNFLFPLFGIFLNFGFFLHVNLAFIIFYFVLAIAIPVADTPKQVLQMEGKEVTPQNLADVVVEEKQPVQHRRGCLGSFFSVIISIFMGIFVGIAAIIGLVLLVCLLLIIVSLVVVFTVPSVRTSLPFEFEDLHLAELMSVHPWIVIVFIIGLLLALCIPLYAIAHMLFSRAGKVQPMGIGQRILWIVLWVASLCCLFPALIWIQEQEKERYNEWIRKEYSYQGVMMDQEDKNFLRKGAWNLIKAENCEHYTWSGEYDGNHNLRFLDVYNENCKEVFQVERKEAVKPGVYRLDCVVRAEGPGPCVYAIGDSVKFESIPVYENLDGKPDMGWYDVSIDNIVVTGDSIAYGLSSDEDFTGQPCRAQWFSATDFKLTRTGDLPKQKK